MTSTNKKKAVQLGMPFGTANAKLRKNILFELVKKLGLDICYQCGGKIESVDTLSIEHKVAWLDSSDPKKFFFDLDNIAFSHLSCNIGERKHPWTGRLKHPSKYAYDKGCRGEACRKIRAQYT